MISSIFIICIQTIKCYPSTSVIWMIVRHILNCGCEAVSNLNMITALFVSAAVQKTIWMFQYDFFKGLIATDGWIIVI